MTQIMGYELINEAGEEMDLNIGGWCFYRQLACAFGWEPAGTQPPDGQTPHEWRGHYHFNDGSLVTAEDAQAMAEALQRALDDPQGPERTRELLLEEPRHREYVTLPRDGVEEVAKALMEPLDAELMKRARSVIKVWASIPPDDEPVDNPFLPDWQETAAHLSKMISFLRKGQFRIW